jgi:citrate lyase subunit beta/citryl-CoA lyase
MKQIVFIRTALFVPGNRPDRVEKAINTAADAVVTDLEDAVPYTLKKETRPVVREKVQRHKGRNIIVRVNPLDSEFVRDDLDEVVVEELSGVIVPKVDTAAHIEEINRLLLSVEEKKGIRPGAIAVIPLIESALAVENIFQIVTQKTEPDRLFTVAFGAADFALDMGIDLTKTGEELSYPRARIVVACRAAGVEPPLDTPFAQRACRLGFQGKLCIHPNQVEICNRIFSPAKEEIKFARRVIQAFDESEAGGRAAIQVDGKFVDYAVAERSRRILKMAERIP